MRFTRTLPALVAFFVSTSPYIAQNRNSATADRIRLLETRLSAADEALTVTETALQNALAEIKQLRAEVKSIRQDALPPTPALPAIEAAETSLKLEDEVRSLREEQEILRAEIKVHEQEKVATSSRYPLRIGGLVLFNAFSNAGVVDDVSVPTLALSRAPGSSHGTLGADARQTMIALDAQGPRFLGASSAAHVSLDFYGGQTYNSFGYRTSAGYARMRDSSGQLLWNHTVLAAGFESPLISPLNPSSYAMLSAPALSGSGNLWNWAPQVRIGQRIPISGHSSLTLEGGLLFPDTPGYTSTQLSTPGQASRRPSVETRISLTSASDTDVPLIIGIGGYHASQIYSPSSRVHPWAITGDWQVPFGSRAFLRGEAYRGAAIGGLGGGVYKDVLQGTDAITGATRTTPVDSAGGWTQLTLKFSKTLQGNVAFGMDDAFSQSFASLNVSTASNAFALYARNQSITSNLIFRPGRYLVFSPEYRRLQTWRHTGSSNIANIYTLSAGYQF